VQISAGRLQVKQFDTPAATYFVDSNAIVNSGNQVNLSDALSLAPGVVSLNRNNYAQDVQISIRGFGARTAFGLRGIRLIADDIPATIPDGQGQASTVSLTSADHIEVLTGPLAQLYGNSSGGVIQTFTKEAGPTPSGQVQAYTGSYGMQRSDWQASSRVGEESLVGVVADYSTFKTDGWRQNSGAQRNQLNSVITYDPQSDTRIKVVLNSFDMPFAQDPLGLSMSQLKANPQQAGTNAVLDATQKTVKQDQIGFVLQQKLSPDTQLQLRVYDGIRDTNQTQAGTSSAGTWIALQRNFNGVGLQLKSKDTIGSMPVQWVIGTDYDLSRENRETGSTSFGIINATSAYLQNTASNNDFFAQSEIHLSDNWSVNAGARADHVIISNANATTPTNGGATSFFSTNPVVGVTWHTTDRFNLYANTGLGFETPTTTEMAYSLPSPLSGLPSSRFNSGLLAAQSHNYEVGAKWLESAHTQMTGAWFLTHTTNDIVTAYSSGGQTVYENAAKTTREGFEFSLNDTSVAHLREQASLTLMRAQYDANYVNANNAFQAVAGNALPAVPKETLYTSLTWSQKGFNAVGKAPNSGAEVELDLSARSTMWANDTNSVAASTNGYAAGYALVDLKLRERVALEKSTLDLYLNVNNVANQSYVGSVIVNQASANYFEPGLPRNWVLGLKWSVPL
jgi:iron complex outermembrane receptor protein